MHWGLHDNVKEFLLARLRVYRGWITALYTYDALEHMRHDDIALLVFI